MKEERIDGWMDGWMCAEVGRETQTDGQMGGGRYVGR